MHADTGTVLAHGAATSPIDMVVGIGPVLLGAVLILFFALLVASEATRGSGWRDERPSAAREIFSGTYPWKGMMLEADIEAHFESLEKPQVGGEKPAEPR